ncbi:CinA family protein [Oricola sp.]|uniref:CinA family protein n=1 Tax=Oricola sp. TaxID=1979950 RepID=UPI003BAA89CE
MNDNGGTGDLVAELLELCVAKDLMLATAESCTGGLIAGALTSIAGSSAMVDRGFVTYTNEAKIEMLGVPISLIEQHGAVSDEVAAAMAEGALAHSNADATISVTGIAGPGGGSDLKPVGLVWFGCAAAWAPTFVHSTMFPDQGRASIREQAVRAALEILAQTIRLAPDRAPD